MKMENSRNPEALASLVIKQKWSNMGNFQLRCPKGIGINCLRNENSQFGKFKENLTTNKIVSSRMKVTSMSAD